MLRRANSFAKNPTNYCCAKPAIMLHNEMTLGMVDVDPGLQQNLLQSNADFEHHNCRPYAAKFLSCVAIRSHCRA